jgi:hypothetical protein
MIYGGDMANDDIEKLLREINETNAPGQSAAPVSTNKNAVKKSDSPSSRGRLPFAVASGVVVGGSGAIFGLLFPFFTIIQTGLTAAVAAFVTALIAGPPRWFSS